MLPAVRYSISSPFISSGVRSTAAPDAADVEDDRARLAGAWTPFGDVGVAVVVGAPGVLVSGFRRSLSTSPAGSSGNRVGSLGVIAAVGRPQVGKLWR